MRRLRLGLFMLGLLQTTAATQSEPDLRLGRAQEEYRVRLSEEPENPLLQYNLGTVLLLGGSYQEAREHLEQAQPLEAEINAPVSYNLGGTDLEPSFRDPELPNRDDRLRRAIEQYKTALRLDPDDVDAKWNLELARLLLEQRPPPVSAGESGGDGGGGGGDDPPTAGQDQPSPAPAGGQGTQPNVSETASEQLLQSAQQRELEVQRDRLQKPRPPGPLRP